MHTRRIVKTSAFTRGVCKIRDFIKFKGFICGIAILRKSSKKTRKSPEKRTFLSLAFYNPPSLHTVDFFLRFLRKTDKKAEFSKFGAWGVGGGGWGSGIGGGPSFHIQGLHNLRA